MAMGGLPKEMDVLTKPDPKPPKLQEGRSRLRSEDAFSGRIAPLPPGILPIVIAGGSFNSSSRRTPLREEDQALIRGILAKADPETEKIFFAETVKKTGAKLVIPVHWDNFFSPLDRPITGMPGFIENTELVFYKVARYCEAHDVNFLIQYPRTSITI